MVCLSPSSSDASASYCEKFVVTGPIWWGVDTLVFDRRGPLPLLDQLLKREVIPFHGYSAERCHHDWRLFETYLPSIANALVDKAAREGIIHNACSSTTPAKGIRSEIDWHVVVIGELRGLMEESGIDWSRSESLDSSKKKHTIFTH